MNLLNSELSQDRVSPASDTKILLTYQFTTSELAKADQFKSFAREFTAMGDVSLPAGRSPEHGFKATISGYSVADLKIAIVESEGFAFLRNASLGMGAGCDPWLFILRMVGTSELYLHEETQTFNSSRMEVWRSSDLRVGHVNENLSFHIYVPREKLIGLEGVLDDIADLTTVFEIHRSLGDYFNLLRSALPDLHRDDACAVSTATTAILRTGLGAISGRDSGQNPTLLARFFVAEKYIRDNLKSPTLSAESMATYLSVSRRQLYKIFEAHGGVYNYIRAKKLDACLMAALDPDNRLRSLRDLAEEYNLRDVNRLGKAFKDRFQCTVGQLRHSCVAEVHRSRYEYWLTDQNRNPDDIV